MWELDHKESWAPKNWCFWTVVLEKTLESPLDCKEMQAVHPKGDQSWVFIGRTDAEAEALILWPPDAKNWLIWKDPEAGKDWSGGGEGDERGWGGWMASPIRWTWVWASSGSWWWSGRPGVLQPMGSQRVGHNWVAELNLTESSDDFFLKPQQPGVRRHYGDEGQWINQVVAPTWSKGCWNPGEEWAHDAGNAVREDDVQHWD